MIDMFRIDVDMCWICEIDARDPMPGLLRKCRKYWWYVCG